MYLNDAIVLARTFTTDGAQLKLIQDRTGNKAAADTPRIVAANLVYLFFSDFLGPKNFENS